MPDEVPLVGGNVGVDVVRVGDTVRRPAGPWSASVDALLLHLEAVGFEAAPRALGYDDQGRQVLSYIDGSIDADPADLDPAQLSLVGRTIREFHAASASFSPPPGAVWNVAIAPDRQDLICHHDLAPWNLVRAQRPVIIDWDGAGPGSRLWDLSYAAHGFVPLSPSARLDPTTEGRRFAALVNGYGLGDAERVELLGLLVPRIWSMHELLATGHREGRETWRRLWAEGHGDAWAADAAYTEQRQERLRIALLP
ncbi:MAG: phosphotransferase [Acidimicrobiales bacterium]